MIPTLSRLESVPLREVWTHESSDFTPWLSIAENLTLLAETLQLGPLELQGTEVPVGNFYIDILARDVDSRIVVIENQFGPTDHTHLGQILTYVAGQDGRATVIWIAETFREEHRAAIDWLNASTAESFNFFAVEVEALRIGTSPVAPWFNVVAKPNNWSRRVGAQRGLLQSNPQTRSKSGTSHTGRGSALFSRKGRPVISYLLQLGGNGAALVALSLADTPYSRLGRSPGEDGRSRTTSHTGVVFWSSTGW